MAEPDKPVVLVENTVNGKPTAMPSRKVAYGSIYGLITALVITLAKKALPDYAEYLDDPTTTAMLVDWLTQPRR